MSICCCSSCAAAGSKIPAASANPTATMQKEPQPRFAMKVAKRLSMILSPREKRKDAAGRMHRAVTQSTDDAIRASWLEMRRRMAPGTASSLPRCLRVRQDVGERGQQFLHRERLAQRAVGAEHLRGLQRIEIAARGAGNGDDPHIGRDAAQLADRLEAVALGHVD